jgi:mannose-6-phosphate isomerase-like protein (cupin superfamily)
MSNASALRCPSGQRAPRSTRSAKKTTRAAVVPDELQKHHHRAEHWTVVSGAAEVTRGNEVFLISENQNTCLPLSAVHRLRDPGKVSLG